MLGKKRNNLSSQIKSLKKRQKKIEKKVPKSQNTLWKLNPVEVLATETFSLPRDWEERARKNKSLARILMLFSIFIFSYGIWNMYIQL